uniref:Protein abrupt n=1 Tax=Bombyx mori TaxID=7091 RepID=A0A8R2R8N5_BOMMO|nr:protein abrupt isoform X4 [Bombyx mori]
MATETGGAAVGGEQQYSLRWNDFHSAMVSSFRRLRDEEDFVDVTLACAGATFTAHKVVLSACSPYFRRLLKANPCQHPIVILRDVHDKDMESLLRFMYQGEVHIGQEQLKEFLKAAQLLQVRGLTDVPAPAPVSSLDQKASPDLVPGAIQKLLNLTNSQQSASSWTETGSGASRDGRDSHQREGRRLRRPEEGAASTPPPKRARSSDLYQAQMKSRCRTEQLLAAQGASPETMGSNGHELALFGHALDAQHPHLSGASNNLSGDGEESSSDAGASDAEGEPRAKQEPLDYDDPATVANTNGAMPHSFPGLLNLQGFPGLPGPSGMPDTYGVPGATGAPWGAGPQLDERPGLANGEPVAKPACPYCGKLYSNNSNLKQHILNVHAARDLAHSCPVCGKAFKTRQYMQIHMNSIHGVKQRSPRRPPPPPSDTHTLALRCAPH